MKDGKNYISYTKNLSLRFEAHMKGKVPSTKYRRPLELIYFEVCLSQNDAIKREKYLKTHYGKMFLGNRLKSYLSSESNLFQEDFTGQDESTYKDELNNE